MIRKEKIKYKPYKKGQVLYVDLGSKPKGVQGGIRPSVVVSCDESNHMYAPQITVCPLSTKLKDKKVHVRLWPEHVTGYHLRKVSDVLPEDIQTVSKDDVRGSIGYVVESKMKELNRAMTLQFALEDNVDQSPNLPA